MRKRPRGAQPLSPHVTGSPPAGAGGLRPGVPDCLGLAYCLGEAALSRSRPVMGPLARICSCCPFGQVDPSGAVDVMAGELRGVQCLKYCLMRWGGVAGDHYRTQQRTGAPVDLLGGSLSRYSACRLRLALLGMITGLVMTGGPAVWRIRRRTQARL